MQSRQAEIVLSFYRSSVVYLLVGGLAGLIIAFSKMQLLFPAYTINTAVIHLAVIGALTLGLFGAYLRLFFAEEQVTMAGQSLQTLLITLHLGLIVLVSGLVFRFWMLLLLGFFGVAWGIIWWTVQYFRMWFQVPRERRRGVLLFGAIASVALVVTVLAGGYLIHGYLGDIVPQHMRLTHIHLGFVGWASLAMLGLGVALQGSEDPKMGSVPALQGTVWVWTAGVILLASFMAGWKLNLVMVGGALLLIGFFGYGYSRAKVGKSQRSDGGNKRWLPFIIIGIAGLFLTLVLGFDLAAFYPSERSLLHRVLGVGAWLLMMFLMILFSELPRVTHFLLQQSGARTGSVSLGEKYFFPSIFRVVWIGVSLCILIIIAGSFFSPVVFYGGTMVLCALLVAVSIYMLITYRPVTSNGTNV